MYNVGMCVEPDSLNVSAIAGAELLAALRTSRGGGATSASQSDSLLSLFNMLLSKNDLHGTQSAYRNITGSLFSLSLSLGCTFSYSMASYSIIQAYEY